VGNLLKAIVGTGDAAKRITPLQPIDQGTTYEFVIAILCAVPVGSSLRLRPRMGSFWLTTARPRTVPI
jgi:hypothetical protein